MATGKSAKVGVGVLVVKKDDAAQKILVSRRRGAEGKQLEPNTWALPGGKLEFGESFEECAARELEEETGICLADAEVPKFEYAVNTVFDENNHFVTIFMSVQVPEDTKAINKEPEKHSDWHWVSWDVLKKQDDDSYLPLMTPLKKLCDTNEFKGFGKP